MAASDDRRDGLPDRPTLEHAPFTDREVERFLAGELDAARSAVIQAAMTNDAALRAHVEDRRAEQRAFAQLNPPPSFLSDPQGRRNRRWFWAIPSVAALAAGLMLAFVREPPDSIRARGVEAEAVRTIDVVVKRGERLFSLGEARSAPLLRAGDALRIDLDVRVPVVLVAGMIDEGAQRGAILLPATAVRAGAWSQPSSFVLDAAVGASTLVVVLATDLAQAHAAEQSIGAGVVPEAARTWRILKEPLP